MMTTFKYLNPRQLWKDFVVVGTPFPDDSEVLKFLVSTLNSYIRLVRLFSETSERNNDYSDILDFGKG